MRDDVGAALVVEAHRTAEVIGVGARDHDGVHVVGRAADSAEAIDEMVPYSGPGSPGSTTAIPRSSSSP